MKALVIAEAGFSLIELMITISIIAVLVAASLFSYTNIQKKSRDASRQSDLKIIQSALEQYKADQGYYPVTTGVSFGSAFTFGSGATMRTYLNKIPQDSATTGYVYRPLPNTPSDCNNTSTLCLNYCLFAKLEIAPGTTTTPPASCGAYPNGYNYYVTQP